MRRRSTRLLAALALLGLLAAGCGSDREDDGAAAPTTTEATDPTEAASFGDLPSPCGEGDAAGATEQGVTDDAITIGYGDDAGFPQSPGLDHELTDAMDAMLEWCNDQGGILGREVVGKYYDAKVTEVTNVMTEACSAVFMLVGEGWSLDVAAEETRVQCGLPAVPGFAVSAAFAHGPQVIQPVPNPVDVVAVQNAAAVAKAFPEEVKKAAVMFGNYPSTISTKDKTLASYPAFGFEFLPCPQEYNIAGEADWKPFAQKLKDCGAEVVYFTGSPFPYFANYLEAANQLDFRPIYMTDANFYDGELAKWNTGGLGDDLYVRQAYIPLEEADEVPAVRQFLDLVEGNGGDANQLGEQAASAFLLWATAAKACGSDLTRACVLEQIGEIDAWTAGGLHAEVDPASNRPPSCGVTVKLEGTTWVRFAPKELGGYDCDDRYVVEITGPVVDQARLGPDRVSRLFEP